MKQPTTFQYRKPADCPRQASRKHKTAATESAPHREDMECQALFWGLDVLNNVVFVATDEVGAIIILAVQKGKHTASSSPP